MNDITTKTIVIAVNIFITITITTLIIVMFFEIQEIYGIVADTDISISSRFDDVYSMYDGKVESGIGLLNTIKKFEENEDQFIIVKYPKSEELRNEIKSYNETVSKEQQKREATELKKLMEQEKTYKGEVFKYENKYNVSVTTNEQGVLIIEFIKINR